MPNTLNFDLELDGLPDHFGRTAKAASDFNRELFITSLPRLLRPKTGLREQLVLSNFSYGRRFFLSKEEDGRLLLFFKRKKREDEVVMDCQVDFELVPIPQPISVTSVLTDEPLFRWIPPPFFILKKEEVRQVLEQADLKGNQAKKEWIVLAVGEGQKERLAVQLKKNNERAKQIRYKDTTYKKLPNKQWQAAPFLAFYRSLLDWINGHAAATPRLLEIDQSNDVRKIVHQMANAFGKVRSGLVATPSEAKSKLWQLAAVHYDVADYQSNILLRLDKEGALALRKSKKSFQLHLQLILTHKESHYEALIRMKIPDFLTGGELYQAFWEAVSEEEDEIVQQLVIQFNNHGFNLDEKELRQHLESNSMGGGAVLRINREYDKKVKTFVDTNLFVWEIEHEGEERLFMFSGKFIVDMEMGTPDVYLLPNDPDLKVPYHAILKELDEEVANYFISVMAYMHNWVEVL